MKKVLVAATAALLAGTAASTADAAVITRNYTTVSTFANGPYLSVTQKYTLSFDPTSNVAAIITNYTTTAGGVLSTVGTANRLYYIDDFDVNFNSNGVRIFYSSRGQNYAVGTDAPGYILDIDFSSNGEVTSSYLQFSDGINRRLLSSITTVDRPPVDNTPTSGAVPEPATWAMMLVGFGGIGFAMRRKKVTTRVRFA